MVAVTIYSRKGCHLCEVAEGTVRLARQVREFSLEVIDIDSNPELKEEYNVDVPVIIINGTQVFRYGVDYDQFLKKLDVL